MQILQITVNISNLGLLISIAMLVVALLGYIRTVRRDNLARMDKKVDISTFDEFKVETASRIGRKLDKAIFDRFEEEVWRDIGAHKQGNDTGFRMLQETIRELQQAQARQTEVIAKLDRTMGEAVTNIQWLVNEGKKSSKK